MGKYTGDKVGVGEYAEAGVNPSPVINMALIIITPMKQTILFLISHPPLCDASPRPSPGPPAARPVQADVAGGLREAMGALVIALSSIAERRQDCTGCAYASVLSVVDHRLHRLSGLLDDVRV